MNEDDSDLLWAIHRHLRPLDQGGGISDQHLMSLVNGVSASKALKKHCKSSAHLEALKYLHL